MPKAKPNTSKKKKGNPRLIGGFVWIDFLRKTEIWNWFNDVSVNGFTRKKIVNKFNIEFSDLLNEVGQKLNVVTLNSICKNNKDFPLNTEADAKELRKFNTKECSEIETYLVEELIRTDNTIDTEKVCIRLNKALNLSQVFTVNDLRNHIRTARKKYIEKIKQPIYNRYQHTTDKQASLIYQQIKELETLLELKPIIGVAETLPTEIKRIQINIPIDVIEATAKEASKAFGKQQAQQAKQAFIQFANLLSNADDLTQLEKLQCIPFYFINDMLYKLYDRLDRITGKEQINKLEHQKQNHRHRLEMYAKKKQLDYLYTFATGLNLEPDQTEALADEIIQLQMNETEFMERFKQQQEQAKPIQGYSIKTEVNKDHFGLVHIFCKNISDMEKELTNKNDLAPLIQKYYFIVKNLHTSTNEIEQRIYINELNNLFTSITKMMQQQKFDESKLKKVEVKHNELIDQF